MSGLPEGWEATTLGDVTYQRGEKINPQDQPELPFIGMDDVEGHTGRLLGQQRTGDFKSSVAHFQVGDILYGRLRPYLNKVWEAEFEGTASAEFIVMPRAAAIMQAYLQKMLMGPDFLDFTGFVSTGDRPRVSFQSMAGFEFPLPPLAEQKRIVARLDRLSARSGKAKEHLAAVQTLATRAKQATLAAAFRGTGANPQAIGQIASVQLGKMLDKDKNTGAEVQYLGNINVRWFGFDLECLKTLRASETDIIKFDIQDGDLMVCEGGEPGRAAIWEHGPTTAIFQKALMRVRPNAGQLVNKYLLFWLYWQAGTGGLESRFTGTTIKHLPKRALEALELPLPSIPEQTEIVRRIETAFAKIDRMADEASRAADLLGRLDQQLLAKAFRGELVPQDPSDEPASALLARIREARANSPKPKRRRKSAKA